MTSIAVNNDNEYYWLADTAGQPIGTLRPVESVADVQELADRESRRHRQQLCVYRVRLVAVGDWIDYHEYIRSDEWREKADAAKERAGHRCQVCYSPDQLDAHHRTYERLGNELPSDITVLCRNCHTTFHKNGNLEREPITPPLPNRPYAAPVDVVFDTPAPEPDKTITIEETDIDDQLTYAVIGDWEGIVEAVRERDPKLPALLNMGSPLCVTQAGDFFLSFEFPILCGKLAEKPHDMATLQETVAESLGQNITIKPVIRDRVKLNRGAE